MQQSLGTILDAEELRNWQRNGYHFCNETPLKNKECLLKAPVTITGLAMLQEEIWWNFNLRLTISNIGTFLRDEINCGRITELAGLPGSGKTRICFDLALSTCLSDSGSIENETVFVSTNYNFAPHYLAEIAHKYKKIYPKLDPEKLLNQINVIKLKTCYEFHAFIKYLENWLSNNKIKLLIIDSISYPLRQVHFSERRNSYNILRGLQALAIEHNFAIILTNDLTTRIRDANVYQTPSFGGTFYHCVNSRIILSKCNDRNCLFSATVVKSVVNQVKSINFTVKF